MKYLVHTVFAILAVVIIVCLFTGCRSFNYFENLENMKLDMPNVDCSTYSQVDCQNYPQCQWNIDRCGPNTLDQANVPTPVV